MGRLFLILSFLLISYQQLIFVQQTFRHGARYPIYPMKQDLTDYAIKQNKVGQLTTEGKKMHYLLGKQIYNLYWDALKLPYALNQSYMFVKSTNVNRTIESAQSHLIGLLEKCDVETIPPGLEALAIPAWDEEYKFDTPPGPVFYDQGMTGYKPLPIHTEIKGANELNSGDYLYGFSSANCPNQDIWQKQNLQSDLANRIRSNPKIVNALETLKSSKLNNTIQDAQKYFDNYQCSLYLQKPYLDIFKKDSTYYEQYRMIHAATQYLQLAFTDSQTYTITSGFFNQTLKNMRNIIKNHDQQRMIIYSAHDITIASLLRAFQLTSADCIFDLYEKGIYKSNGTCIYEFPPFAASLILELWQNGTSNYVKMRYLGEYVNMPFCGGAPECNFDNFSAFLNSKINPNYLKDCGVQFYQDPDPIKADNTGLIIGIALTSAALLGIIFYESIRFVKKRKQAMAEKQYDKNNLEEA